MFHGGILCFCERRNVKAANSEGTVSLGVCFSSPENQAVDHSLIIVAIHE